MSIELIVGPMFSGKTKTLLRRIRALERDPNTILLCITHSDDDRYTISGPQIISHDGDSHMALAVRELMPLVSSGLYRDATHIIIEESQFFPDLFPFVKQGADAHHKSFLCAGLDGDFLREPFGQLIDLVPYCDSIQKLKANCARCSESGTAIFTARRRGKGSDQVYIGGKETYEPMCRRHYIQYYYE
jgi:thymidine kinase